MTCGSRQATRQAWLTQLCACCVVATLISCAPDGGGNSSRGVEQDIAATRNAGPTSAEPGAFRGTRTTDLPQPTESAEQAVPSPVSPKAAAAPPSAGLGGLAQDAAVPGNARVGRRFSLDNCRPCHVVAADQRSPVRFANAPDFRTIATSPNTTQLGLTVWLTNPHPTMPTLVLSPQEARDVIAYIQSLRGAR